MSEYSPPLRDIKFVLEHVTDLPGIAELTGAPDVDSLFGALDEAARLMVEVVAPTNRAGDTEGSTISDGVVTAPAGFKEAYTQYVEAGWASLPFPEQSGGHALPVLVSMAVEEMLTSANMSLSLAPMLTHGTIDALMHHGTEEQQQTFLEPLVAGRWAGTMHLTEPQAGSDVGALTARAEPAADGSWRLYGTKIFITWGEHDLTENIIHMVLARTPDSPPGTKGISLFIVPKYLVNPDGSLGERNDIHTVSIEHKLGINASPTCVMALGEGDGAVGYMVGEENQGMRCMFTMMNGARISVGLEGLAITERAFQQGLAFAQERRQGRAIGAPKTEHSLIIEHPDVRRMLLTQKAYIEAMRGLLYEVAATVDRAQHHPDADERARNAQLVALLTPVAKAWPTDLGVEMTSLNIQVHGGMGYVEETGAAQHLRDARIAPIYEGTNGIQAIDLVARKLSLEGGAVVGGLFRAIGETAAAAEGTEGLAEMGRALAKSLADLSEVTTWLAEHGGQDPNHALAGATPYLRMFGQVVGGWMMARSALAAHHLLATGEGDPDFCAAKIAIAEFYCTQLLGEVHGLLGAVTGGAAPLFAVEPKHLG